MRADRSIAVVCTIAAAAGILVPSYAQAVAPPPIAPSTDKVEEARARFQRALELAEDGDFDASLLELRRAYELAPSYRILYNIGLVYQQLKEHARAYDAFERYLSEGGANVEPERADEVRHRIERLKGRVGYLNVATTIPGAEIFVDDLRVGETPFPKALRVNSGQRRLTVRMAGHPSETRVVELAGGETRSVVFDLRLAAGAGPAPPRSPVPWISWGATAAVGAGAAVTGILALKAKSDYDSQASMVNANLDSAYSKLHTLAITTDILLGVTIVGIGVSTYFTIRPPKVRSGSEGAAAVRMGPAGVSGTF